MSRELRVKKTYTNICRPVFVYCKLCIVSNEDRFHLPKFLNYKHQCKYKYEVFMLLYLLFSVARMLADFPSWTSKMHFRWHRGNISTPVMWFTWWSALLKVNLIVRFLCTDTIWKYSAPTLISPLISTYNITHTRMLLSFNISTVFFTLAFEYNNILNLSTIMRFLFHTTIKLI